MCSSSLIDGADHGQGHTAIWAVTGAVVMGVEDIYAAAAARVEPGVGYAGDVTADEAWRLLNDDADAVLVDVRTQAEWMFVGIPDLGPAGKEALLVQWQVFPAMSENPNFADELAAKGATPAKAALFICRTANRSPQAARAMTARGYPRCYVVSGGFEGPPDGDKHRGTRDGWKAAGLPWVQG